MKTISVFQVDKKMQANHRMMYQGKLSMIRLNLLEKQSMSEEKLQDLCCAICMDLSTHPVACSVCKSVFCMKCAALWKSEKNECPKHCHSPWRYEPIGSLKVALECPYSADCPTFYPQDMIDHFKDCKGESSELAEIKSCLRRRDRYLCSNDHPLQFWVGSYNQMVSTECSECKEIFACRSVCWHCSEKYCVLCRPPPCTKNFCPKGHKYLSYIPGPTYVCDMCGLKSQNFGEKCYDDIRCNSGMCESCHELLPDTIDFEIILNDCQSCDKCSEDLSFLPDSQQALCGHCRRTIRTERLCDNCNIHYCMECKPIAITKKNTCLKKHSLLQNQEYRICTSCRLYETPLADLECGFALCEDCLQIAMDKVYETERISGYNCPEDTTHELAWDPSTSQCHQCKQLKMCYLQCPQCNLHLCLACRPSFYGKEDYFGHKYEVDSEPRPCSNCDKQVNESWYCWQCDIALCEHCYKQ